MGGVAGEEYCLSGEHIDLEFLVGPKEITGFILNSFLLNQRSSRLQIRNST